MVGSSELNDDEASRLFLLQNPNPIRDPILKRNIALEPIQEYAESSYFDHVNSFVDKYKGLNNQMHKAFS